MLSAQTTDHAMLNYRQNYVQKYYTWYYVSHATGMVKKRYLTVQAMTS